MSRERSRTRPIGVNRLMALTDGVFAIAMTILVLELGVPTASEATTDSALGQMLGEMWPDFLMYGLSFLLLGMFWLMHHAVFDNVIQYDFTLQWLNIAYLLFAALIPFTTVLFGEHGATQWTALLYGLNMLVVVAAGWGLWSYVSTGHRLVRPDLDPTLIRDGRRMGYVYAGVMAIPIILAFVSPTASFILYGLIVLGFFLATVTGQWETVMLLPSEAPHQD